MSTGAVAQAHDSLLISISETARRARLSRRQVRNILDSKDGEFVVRYIGDRLWIVAESVERFKRRCYCPPDDAQGGRCGNA
jgi:hypothetical protein